MDRWLERNGRSPGRPSTAIKDELSRLSDRAGKKPEATGRLSAPFEFIGWITKIHADVKAAVLVLVTIGAAGAMRISGFRRLR